MLAKSPNRCGFAGVCGYRHRPNKQARHLGTDRRRNLLRYLDASLQPQVNIERALTCIGTFMHQTSWFWLCIKPNPRITVSVVVKRSQSPDLRLNCEPAITHHQQYGKRNPERCFRHPQFWRLLSISTKRRVVQTWSGTNHHVKDKKTNPHPPHKPQGFVPDRASEQSDNQQHLIHNAIPKRERLEEQLRTIQRPQCNRRE